MKRTYFNYVVKYAHNADDLERFLNRQSKLGYAIFQIHALKECGYLAIMRMLVSVDEEGHKEALE